MEVKALEDPFGARVLGLDLTAPLATGEREAADRSFTRTFTASCRAGSDDPGSVRTQAGDCQAGQGRRERGSRR